MELYSANDEEYKFTDVYDAISDAINQMPDYDWIETGITKVFKGETYGDSFTENGEEVYSIRNVKELTFKITNYDEGTCDFDFEEVVDG